jgi:two-component system, OmpR family, phosphate regulon sensor histidine kinase PhoR
MIKRRLLWQLFPAYLLLMVLSLSALTYFSIRILDKIYVEKKIAELTDRLLLIEDIASEHMLPDRPTRLDSVIKVTGRRANTRITLILPDGRVIADSDEDPTQMDNHGDRPEIRQALAGGRGTSIRYSYTLKAKLMYVALALESGGETTAVLRVAVPLTLIENFFEEIRNKILWIVLIVVCVFSVLTLVVSRRISHPLEEMQQGIENFTRGDFSFRLAKPKSLEVGKLAEALNQMAEQIDDKIKTIIEQKNEQQAVLESMVEGVLAIDRDEKIIHLNNAAAKLLHIDAAAVTAASIQEVVRNVELQILISKTLQENSAVEGEILLRNKSDHYLQVHGTVLKDAAGQTMGAVIVLNDVTRLRRLENVRRDFVANVSHEIRTPLTSIKGFAETLLGGALEDREHARKFIEIISKQSNRLNAIIDDLLILARLEQEGERTKIDFESGSLRSVINEALQICAPKAKDKNIQLQSNCKQDLQIQMNSDLVEQAVVNLIDNAVKYSPHHSSVTITVEKLESEVMIDVTDHGVGIERKHLPRLFERFYRADKARSRELGGTGLGLAIVKHIAQVHGGRVWADSIPGKGSSFRIYIPVSL